MKWQKKIEGHEVAEKQKMIWRGRKTEKDLVIRKTA